MVTVKNLWAKGTMPMQGRSKTCQVPFAAELIRKWGEHMEWGKGVRSNAIQPVIVSTGLNNGLEKGSMSEYPKKRSMLSL